MSTRQIHIFISHAWVHSHHYNTLREWIFSQKWRVGQASLQFLDYSVPKHDPIHNAINDLQLKRAIFDKIARSHVVIIPAGMYAARRKWIQKEIEGAKQYGKPILSVNPMGQLRKPGVVTSNANKAVGWNRKPVINSIWELYKEQCG